MCGIAGIFSADPTIKHHISYMVSATEHRGPDDHGIYRDDHIALGHNRLSIIDLSAAGHQPMISRDKRYVMVFNGEVYNYRQNRLMLEQEGVVFDSLTDSEVVLNLFIKYGKACVEHLRGMFAFAIWDSVKKELFAARDHLGIKPFLYSLSNGVFIFASELKGMLGSGLIPRNLSHTGMNLFLQKGFIAPPYTAIENVQSLLPGHYLTYDEKQGLNLKNYWDIKPAEKVAVSYNDAVKMVKSAILEAVEEELVSDVPLGVFLSGGLDSSVMVAAMRLLNKSDISTFSIGFDNGSSLDESNDAEESAKHFKTKHHNVIINSSHLHQHLDKFIRGLDQPSVDGLNTFLVAQCASERVTVAISGLGGDELFAGYAWQHRFYKATSLNLIIARCLLPFEPLFDKLGKFGNQLKNRYTNNINAHATYQNIHLLFKPEKIAEYTLCNTDSSKLKETIKQFPIDHTYSRLQQINKLDLRYFMSAQLLRDSDAVSMIHSLEVRFPLTDIRLVDLVYNLPDDFKIQHGLTVSELNKGYEQQLTYKDGGIKKLLFDAFASELPDSLNNRSKRGFKLPYENWMKEDHFMSEITRSLKKLEGIITQKGSTEKLLSDWATKKIGWQHIWALFILQLWMEENNINVR